MYDPSNRVPHPSTKPLKSTDQEDFELLQLIGYRAPGAERLWHKNPGRTSDSIPKSIHIQQMCCLSLPSNLGSWSCGWRIYPWLSLGPYPLQKFPPSSSCKYPSSNRCKYSLIKTLWEKEYCTHSIPVSAAILLRILPPLLPFLPSVFHIVFVGIGRRNMLMLNGWDSQGKINYA